MQGWRVSQEDAHNCILDFDTDTSYFAVYDGHGGHEVAQYCAQKLPQFIKDLQAYKDDDIIIATLKEMAGEKEAEESDDENKKEDDNDEENVKNLYEEAAMPIEQVIEKYTNLVNPSLKNLKKLDVDKLSKSSFLKVKKESEPSVATSSASSSSEAGGFLNTLILLKVAVLLMELVVHVIITQKFKWLWKQKGSDFFPLQLHSAKDIVSQASKCCTLPQKMGRCFFIHFTLVASISHLEHPNALFLSFSLRDSDDLKEAAVASSNEVEISKDKTSISPLNGEVSETPLNSDITSSSTQENGELKGKGKGKTIVKNKVNTSPVKERPSRNARQLYKTLLEFGQDSEDDTEDEEDKTFEGPNDASSEDDDEGVNAAIEAEASDESSLAEEAEEEEDEIDDEDDEDLEFARNMKEEPGSDSGCTAVVALLRENKLYVANAGDSRCIVCRNEQRIDFG
ncbi:hypothetical protein NQ317_013989 [Molorchus minor]|uniref:protein-serine/threonine phosphatase n=1 Tax=Molorchus minor TaxID=1323400 RepID=A0ABQ9JH72_9CUCU|nr:hypothetical protein NQ317_013989 [Molorchus minor]